MQNGKLRIIYFRHYSSCGSVGRPALGALCARAWWEKTFHFPVSTGDDLRMKDAAIWMRNGLSRFTSSSDLIPYSGRAIGGPEKTRVLSPDQTQNQSEWTNWNLQYEALGWGSVRGLGHCGTEIVALAKWTFRSLFGLRTKALSSNVVRSTSDFYLSRWQNWPINPHHKTEPKTKFHSANLPILRLTDDRNHNPTSLRI